jgi:hypothetical protein
VPHALEACARIATALSAIGVEPSAGLPDREALRKAATTWRDAVRHFVVQLAPATVRARVRARLAVLPPDERVFWERALASSAADTSSLGFLSLSLDALGRPIRVANTDPAMGLFLEDLTPEHARRVVDVFTRPYPVGLFVERLGPVVANDAYATPRIWDAFRKDAYHSPRVVWGREVNLLFLALARQIAAAYDDAGRLRDSSQAQHVEALAVALRRTLDAVEASGLSHNELWSYRIVNGELTPVRYGSSSDIQLWNLTSLAVQFRLSQLRRP